MSNDEDLDPHIVASLRAVTAATDEVRDAHIAQALSHLNSSSSHQRGSLRNSCRWLATAAAVLLLIGGFVTAQNSDDDSPTLASASDSTNPIKNSAGQTGSCGNADATNVGSYDFLSDSREVWAGTNGISVYATDTCTKLVVIDHVAAPADSTVCLPSLANTTDSIVGHYTAKNGYRVLVNTATHLEVYGAPDCTVLARYPHP